MKEAIILAGGLGTRLRHVVSDVPKPMAPIGERPFLEFVLDHLVRYEFAHVVFSTGHLHEKIEQHFGCEYKGIRISYAQETTPLGTGGGILNALQHCQNETVTVLNGDTMFKVDYSALELFHQQNGTMLSIFLRQVDDTSRYGSVEIDNSHRIIRFAEKSESQGQGWINGGIYRMDKALFDGYQVGDTFSFEKDIMQANYQSKSLFALPSSSYFIDIGVPDDYFRAQKELI